jgi:hypothetical protein
MLLILGQCARIYSDVGCRGHRLRGLIFGQCAWIYPGVGCRSSGPILQATRRHISYLRHHRDQTIPTVAGRFSSLVSVLGSTLA